MDATWAEKYKETFSVTDQECRRVWERSVHEGVRWSYIGAADFPKGWMHLSKPPPPLFSYRGDPVWMKYPALSVVGSRTPMRSTCLWLQLELSRFLHEEPAVVVSGGARGVDQWAHRICMDAGLPTVCIFPSGILNPYPPGCETFAQRILDTGGALISTFPLEAEMRKGYFHARNRLITGISPMTFVVEANRRSGSSLTGKYADEEGRMLCTLPVFPHSSQGLANLDLITENKAAMIRDHQDLVGNFRTIKNQFLKVKPTNASETSGPPPEI